MSEKSSPQEKPSPDDALDAPALIGEELARRVTAMEKILEDFHGPRYVSRAEILTLQNALAGMRHIAKCSQQLSRLAGGRLRQSHERFALDEVVRNVILDQRRKLTRRGIQIEEKLQPIEVIVDPTLLVSLVEAALDWSAARGQRVQIRLGMLNWPEHAMLVFRSRPQVSSSSPTDSQTPMRADDLDWLLMVQVAAAIGVLINREISGQQLQLTIEFPRTVRRLEGLTAIEVDTGGAANYGESRPMAGHRILLVSADDKLKADIEYVCANMGLVVDRTPTARQAVRFCELEKPHLIIVDERLRDWEFDRLRQDLLEQNVNFPFVEIAQDSNVAELASWVGDRMSRVSRDSVRSQLPSILTMELAKID